MKQKQKEKCLDRTSFSVYATNKPKTSLKSYLLNFSPPSKNAKVDINPFTRGDCRKYSRCKPIPGS